MKITKAWVDAITPKHGRTSCRDNDLSNCFGGWTGKYDENTGKKVIQHPRCNRCYLLDHLGEELESLPFEVEVSLYWKKES